MDSSVIKRVARRAYSAGRGPVLAVAAVSAVTIAGCKLDQVVDPSNGAVAALDRAISQITSASSSWQAVLQGAVAKLTDGAQSTVRVELQALLDSSIAAVEVGAICTVDFVGTRVVGELAAIKAKLLGRALPPPSPLVCSSAPSAVERAAWQQNRVPVVTLTGYDLKVPLIVRLVETTGTTVIAGAVAEISPYQATIKLGATGLHLTPASQRITVSTAATPPSELAGINVVQPHPRICDEKDLVVTAAPIGFTPSFHASGDNEFDGNGPEIYARIAVMPIGQKLKYSIYMTAQETGGDHTQVTGSGQGELFLTPPIPSTMRIASVIGALASACDYVDTNTTDDFVSSNIGGPVNQFRFVGDTVGDDVGKTRLVSATFNPIGLHIVEQGNCVTRTEAEALLKSEAQLTPALASQLRAAVSP